MGLQPAHRRIKRLARSPQPGILSWQSHDEVVGARRRTAWAAVVLAAGVLLWMPALFEGVHTNAFTGGVILEVFTLVPLGLVLNRLRRLNRLIKRMKVLGLEEQRDDAEQLRRVDDAMFRIARLTTQLPNGLPETTGREGFQAAERASREWRRLLTRQNDIEALIAMTKGTTARRSLERSLAACRDDASGFEGRVGELAAALAALIDSSEDDVTREELARVQSAAERVDALAQGFEELNALVDRGLAAP